MFEVDAHGVRFSGHRKADNYCVGGYGDDDKLDVVLAALEGIETVFVAKIGRCPKGDLKKAGIEAVDEYAFDYIETAVASWYAKTFATQSGSASIA